MKVEVKKGQDSTCTLEVTIEAEQIDDAYGKHLKKAARSVAIPGFRKGKAPLKIAERHLNKDMIMQQVLEELAPPALQDAIEKENLSPLSEPSMDIDQFEKGKDMIIKATFEVKPEVELDEYTGFEIEQEKADITDEDVDKTLAMMRENAASLSVVEEERGLEVGDFSIVDFESSSEGEPLDGGSEKNYVMEVKEDMYIPGFVDNLKGMKKDEEKEFQVTFPENYEKEDLKGKKVDFKFKLIEIKKKSLPDLNDDFAKEVSKFETLDEFKQDIREQLIKKTDDQARAGVEEQINEKLIKKVDVPLPESLIAYEQDVLYNNLKRNFAAQGINFEDNMQKQNLDLSALKTSLRPQAESMGKLEMALEAISTKENIEVEDSEVDEKIKEIAGEIKQDFEKLKEMLQQEGRVAGLKYEMLKRKTIDFLIDNSRVSYVPPGSKEKKEDEEAAEGEGIKEEKEAAENVEQEAAGEAEKEEQEKEKAKDEPAAEEEKD